MAILIHCKFSLWQMSSQSSFLPSPEQSLTQECPCHNASSSLRRPLSAVARTERANMWSTHELLPQMSASLSLCKHPTPHALAEHSVLPLRTHITVLSLPALCRSQPLPHHGTWSCKGPPGRGTIWKAWGMQGHKMAGKVVQGFPFPSPGVSRDMSTPLLPDAGRMQLAV